jgi:hypothetical protein
VGAVVLGLAGHGPLGGSGFERRGVDSGGGAAVVGAVRAAGVVVLGEGGEVVVERGEGAVFAVNSFASTQPFLQRLRGLAAAGSVRCGD